MQGALGMWQLPGTRRWKQHSAPSHTRKQCTVSDFVLCPPCQSRAATFRLGNGKSFHWLKSVRQCLGLQPGRFARSKISPSYIAALGAGVANRASTGLAPFGKGSLRVASEWCRSPKPRASPRGASSSCQPPTSAPWHGHCLSAGWPLVPWAPLTVFQVCTVLLDILVPLWSSLLGGLPIDSPEPVLLLSTPSPSGNRVPLPHCVALSRRLEELPKE